MWPFRPPQPAATPSWDTPIDAAQLLAVDVETTGLEPKNHRLLSIGWVPIDGRSILLGQAGYVVLQATTGDSVGASATIHRLTDDILAAGVAPAEALEQFLTALKGRMMLAHFAQMEQEFLADLYRRVRGERVRFPAVDTLAIERRHMERMATYPRGEDLRLPRARRRYGLPAYRNHNALTDALACAELYLAQQGVITARTLGDLKA
ncbi:DNA polymerase III subunit epsilon [Corynebacterium yudongzhengii]|uniref:DNA polymerase III subunit epsilon n=1 Tax=Corynebacterium yudongzhengii TaxID=2080740 RepID=A0A2U1T9E1_9CORY|nr:exonuclease domain-containing protein [Corynebacterium yudongzhengii]AWB82051.1 DNA polymerase III subunit epsilon [Corynebacterium yudongzhengii]PWC02555.1 DNA polymerase III subunit epsilon [Corynebacterium yudongzhengii]